MTAPALARDEVTTRRATRRAPRRLPEAVLVVLITAASAVPGLLVALTDGGPSVFGDELLYRDNAHAIATASAYANPHYPPAYSVLLALGYVTEHWFRAMLLLNVVAAAAIVPATWFLARSLQIQRTWIPMALAAVLPFHGAFAGYLLSENLALPLFVLCVALAVRGRRGEAAWLGLALGALHLTRYFFLPAVLLLGLVWVLRVLRTTDSRRWLRTLGSTAVMAGAYLVLLAAWSVYGTRSGHPFGRLWGVANFTGEEAVAAGADPARALLTWATHYSSYLVLAAPVVLALVILWVIAARPGVRTLWRWSSTTAFAATTAAATLGFIAVSSAHSLAAAYNYPEPTLMQGRYMMHLVPILVVAGCLALERLSDRRTRPGVAVTVGVGVAAAGLAWGAWWVLFRGGLWGVPDWGVRLPFNAPDVFVLDSVPLVAAVAAAAVVVPLLARSSAGLAAGAWIAVAAAVLAAGVAHVMTPPVNGTQGRELAAVVADRTAAGQPVTLWLSNRFAGVNSVRQALEFWDVDLELVTFEEWDGALDAALTQACLVTTGGSQDLWATNSGAGPGAIYEGSDLAGGFSVYQVSEPCLRDLAGQP